MLHELNVCGWNTQGSLPDPSPGGRERSREVRDQVHQNHETPAQEEQLQFVFGAVVRPRFSTDSKVGLCEYYPERLC